MSGWRHAEQLRDDRADAAEVLGAARGALQSLGDAEHLDASWRSRADRPPRPTGANSRSAPASRRQLGVAGLLAGVALEVGALVELGGVDEQRDDDHDRTARGRARSARGDPRAARPSWGRGRSSGRRDGRARAPRAAHRRCGASSSTRCDLGAHRDCACTARCGCTQEMTWRKRIARLIWLGPVPLGIPVATCSSIQPRRTFGK